MKKNLLYPILLCITLFGFSGCDVLHLNWFSEGELEFDITYPELEEDNALTVVVSQSGETADTLAAIVEEVSALRETERGNRADDKRSESAMEDRKKQGYF